MAEPIHNQYSEDSSSSGSEEEEILLLLLLLRRRRRRLKASRRKISTKRWKLRRQANRVFTNLVQELRDEDAENFRQYHRLDKQSFEEVNNH